MRLRRLAGDTVPLQAAAALALVAQNLLGPWWYGREAFGEATRALALPYLLQGLIEPIIVSLWIASTAGGEPGLALRRRLVFDTVLVLGAGVLAASALALESTGATAQSVAGAIAAVITFPLLLMSTLLIARVYTRKEFGALAWALLANALSFVMVLVIARPWSAAGFVIAIAVSHVILQVVLKGHLIAIWRETWPLAAFSGRSETLAPRPWARYIAALAPKASLLWFNAGVLFVGSLLLVPSELAHLKVALVMAFAVLHVLPVSPYVLQAHSASSEDALGLRRLGHGLLFLTIILAVAAGVLWFALPWVERWLLGLPNERFRMLAWAAPGIGLTALLGALLTVRGALRALVGGSLAGIALTLAVLGGGSNVALATLAGLYSTVLVYAWAFVRLAKG